ncbi:hypothetical protein HON52_02700 [Candidatus Uhrbacteria bacterium]|jgi:hypothetical protein|nr:hypothetical protein [Candidatus Uhrbacteria bacterium]
MHLRKRKTFKTHRDGAPVPNTIFSYEPLAGIRASVELDFRDAKKADLERGREVSIPSGVKWIKAPLNGPGRGNLPVRVAVQLDLSQMARNPKGFGDKDPHIGMDWSAVVRPQVSLISNRTLDMAHPQVRSGLHQTCVALLETQMPIHTGACISCVVGYREPANGKAYADDEDPLAVFVNWSSTDGLFRLRRTAYRNNKLRYPFRWPLLQVGNSWRRFRSTPEKWPTGFEQVPLPVPEDRWNGSDEDYEAVRRAYDQYMSPAMGSLMRAVTKPPHVQAVLRTYGIDLCLDTHTRIQGGRTRVVAEQAQSVVREVFRVGRRD